MALLDDYLTITTAAARIGIRRETLHRWITDGLVPTYLVGKRRMIKAGDLTTFVGTPHDRVA